MKDEYQRERLAKGSAAALRASVRRDPSTRTAFAHETPAKMLAIFPQGRFLLLFRDTIAHRLSFAAAGSRGFTRHRRLSPAFEQLAYAAQARGGGRNFSEWIRSDEYVHSRGLQLRWARDALDGETPGLNARIDPVATALSLFHSPERVRWVGVLDHWDSSMCLLTRALGFDGAFYGFARALHTRRYRPALPGESESADNRLNGVYMATQLSSDDHDYLLTLEAAEIRFVSLVSRLILEREAADGVCECAGGGAAFGAAQADLSEERLP